jgi:hypothetical protein
MEMGLKDIGSEDVYCIHLTHDRVQWRVLVRTVMNHRVP